MIRINISQFPIKLDLGCGESKKQDFVGLDLKDCGQEIVWDITKGLPLPDNSVEELYSSHFVEHIADKDIPQLFDEIARVCKNDAQITIHCPHADTTEAFYSTHISLWTEKRIRGIWAGYMNSKIKFTEPQCQRNGIELQMKFRIIK